MPRIARLRSLRLAATLALVLSAGSAWAAPSNKWRIEVDSDARSGGEIVFELTPVSGMPVEIVVAIPAPTDENAVAGLIRDALVAHLGSAYRVELDDGEHVLVKKQDGAADFELRLVRQTVGGAQIALDPE